MLVTVLIACTPPGFNFLKLAQPQADADDAKMLTNLGGVCLFCHSTLRTKRVFSLTTIPSNTYMTGSTLSLLFVVLYCPGSVNASGQFFDDFSDVMEGASIYATSLIVAGDVNIHLDDISALMTIKFTNILDSQVSCGTLLALLIEPVTVWTFSSRDVNCALIQSSWIHQPSQATAPSSHKLIFECHKIIPQSHLL